MTTKKKGESSIRKIIIGITIAVVSTLIIALLNVALQDNPTPTNGGRPGATKVR